MLTATPASGDLLLFCGLPGTLKTFLSARIAGALGFAYLPTRAAGVLESGLTVAALEIARLRRYEQLADIVGALVAARVDIVVDGGFATNASRTRVFGAIPPSRITIVHCRCADDGARRSRLSARATDLHDHEARSAREILATERSSRPPHEDPARQHLEQGAAACVLEVETDTHRIIRYGESHSHFAARLSDLVLGLLGEHTTMVRSRAR